jgi:hypothetical protein
MLELSLCPLCSVALISLVELDESEIRSKTFLAVDEGETKHLQALDGAGACLRLF